MGQWRPIWEIVFGTGALIVSLIIHGIGMFYIQRLNRDYQRLPPLHLRREAAFSLLIFLMLVTHLLEILLWAGALITTGAVQLFRDAYYYVAVTYTTLGYAEGTRPVISVPSPGTLRTSSVPPRASIRSAIPCSPVP